MAGGGGGGGRRGRPGDVRLRKGKERIHKIIWSPETKQRAQARGALGRGGGGGGGGGESILPQI